MKNRKIYLIVAAALGLAAAGAAFAHGWRSHESRAAWGLERIAEELELNDYQRTQLEAVKNTLRSTHKAARAQLAARHEAMLGLLAQPTFDRQGAQALVEQSTRAMNERASQVIAAVGDFYDSLAPDQQQKLRAALAERMERSHRRGHGARDGS